MSERASDDVEGAVGAALGALLSDADVFSIDLVEGGALEVERRGRRDHLPADVDPALYEALRAAGAPDRLLELELEHGHQLTAAAGPSGLVVHVEKALQEVPGIPTLLEEGMLSGEAAAGLMEAVLSGTSVLVGGPCRSGRERLAAALAGQAAHAFPVAALDPAPPSAAGPGAPAALSPVPWPLEVELEGQPEGRLARATVARALGRVGLWARELTVVDARALVALGDCVVIAAWPVSRAPADLPTNVLHVAVGFAPDGAPELKPSDDLELWMVPRAPVSSMSTALVRPAAAAARGPAVRSVEDRPARDRPEAAAPSPAVLPAELPPLKPLAPGPPDGWAHADVEVSPGWELDDDGAPLAPVDPHEPRGLAAHLDEEGAARFEATLREVQRRPTFKPRPPQEHPQARQLRGEDPLAGLTLEPPPGGDPLDDDDDEEGAG